MPLTGPLILDLALSLLTGECLSPSADTISSTRPAPSKFSNGSCVALGIAAGREECCERLRCRKRLALSRDRARVVKSNRNGRFARRGRPFARFSGRTDDMQSDGGRGMRLRKKREEMGAGSTEGTGRQYTRPREARTSRIPGLMKVSKSSAGAISAADRRFAKQNIVAHSWRCLVRRLFPMITTVFRGGMSVEA